jgi:ADP-ribosylglycohydrolase
MVESARPSICSQYVQEVLRPQRLPGFARGPFHFGQYSDDTQLARELLISYVACHGFRPEDYARRIANLFRNGRVVGRGRATEAAAFRIAAGVPWQEAGTPAPSAGNGSAMRAAPIGLLFDDDFGALAAAAEAQSRITHHDPRCAAGAVAIAGAVALSLRPDPIETAPFVAQLQHLMQPYSASFAESVGRLNEWVALDPNDAAPEVIGLSHTPEFEGKPLGITAYVVPSVLWSLYAFLRSPEDYWEAICTAIAVGGDVDTTAAMAGAISGARNGREALPEHYLKALNDQDTWHSHDLQRLAEEAYDLKAAALSL